MTKPVTWMIVYAILVTIGMIIGYFQDTNIIMRLFIAYLSVFLLFHAALPFLISKSPKNKWQKISGTVIKIIFPTTSVIGWIIIWNIVVKAGI